MHLKKKLGLAAATAVAAMAFVAPSAMAWDVPSAPNPDNYTFSAVSGDELVTTLSGGPTVESLVTDFYTTLDAGDPDTGVVYDTFFDQSSSSTGLNTTILGSGYNWSVLGVGSGSTGSATVSGVVFTSYLRLTPGGTVVGTITVSGSATGAYDNTSGDGVLSFGAAGDSLSVTSATGAGLTYLGNTADLTGSVSTPSGPDLS